MLRFVIVLVVAASGCTREVPPREPAPASPPEKSASQEESAPDAGSTTADAGSTTSDAGSISDVGSTSSATLDAAPVPSQVCCGLYPGAAPDPAEMEEINARIAECEAKHGACAGPFPPSVAPEP